MTTEDRRQELTAAVDAEHVEDRLQVVLYRGLDDAQRLPISLVDRPRATACRPEYMILLAAAAVSTSGSG